MNEQLLDGKIAVVTGGGSGMGAAAARAMAREGATVVLAGRDPEQARSGAIRRSRPSGGDGRDVCDGRHGSRTTPERSSVSSRTRIRPTRYRVQQCRRARRSETDRRNARGGSRTGIRSESHGRLFRHEVRGRGDAENRRRRDRQQRIDLRTEGDAGSRALHGREVRRRRPHARRRPRVRGPEHPSQRGRAGRNEYS